MKRYIVFGGSCYYAEGGIHDFLSSHDAIEDAIEGAVKWSDEQGLWWHVLDGGTWKIVAQSWAQAHGSEDFSDAECSGDCLVYKGY